MVTQQTNYEPYVVFVIKAHNGRIENGAQVYYKDLVELQLIANSEKEAIKSAKGFITRDEFITTQIIENFRKSVEIKHDVSA